MRAVCLLPVVIRKLSSPNHDTNNQKRDWDAEKKYNCAHLISLFVFTKYVTRYVTTQGVCLRLTTFNTHFSGSTTK